MRFLCSRRVICGAARTADELVVGWDTRRASGELPSLAAPHRRARGTLDRPVRAFDPTRWCVGNAVSALVLLPGCADEVVGYFSTGPGTSSDPTVGVGSGSESAGFVPPGCFGDDFEDGVLDGSRWNTWVEQDAGIEELGGNLRLTPPSYGLFDTGLVGHFDYRFPFEDAWARMRIATPPAAGRPVVLFLFVDGGSGMLAVSLSDDVVRAGTYADEQLVQERELPVDPYPAWVGIRDDAGIARFEVSEDGQAWTTIATLDEPGSFRDSTVLVMAQTFGDAPEQAVVAVDEIEVCVQ